MMKIVTNNGSVKGGLDMDLRDNNMKVNPINDRLTPVTTLIPVLHTHTPTVRHNTARQMFV